MVDYQIVFCQKIAITPNKFVTFIKTPISALNCLDKYVTPKLSAQIVEKYKTPNSDIDHLSTKHLIVTKTPNRHGQNMSTSLQQARHVNKMKQQYCMIARRGGEGEEGKQC